jgi:hypothetical protein
VDTPFTVTNRTDASRASRDGPEPHRRLTGALSVGTWPDQVPAFDAVRIRRCPDHGQRLMSTAGEPLGGSARIVLVMTAGIVLFAVTVVFALALRHPLSEGTAAASRLRGERQLAELPALNIADTTHAGTTHAGPF